MTSLTSLSRAQFALETAGTVLGTKNDVRWNKIVPPKIVGMVCKIPEWNQQN